MLLAASAGWKKAGIAGEIVCTGERRGALASRLEESGFAVHHVRFARSFRHIVAIYRLIRNSRCQVVHLHTERANGWYALAALAAGKRKILRTVHNVFPFRGALRARRYASRAALRLLGVRSIAISESVRRCEADTFRNPTEVIPNWFDDGKYLPPSAGARDAARRQLGIADDVFAVVTVGGCWEYKNHDAILRALASLPPGEQILYLHVGMEDEQRSEARLAVDLGVEKEVRFAGIVDDIAPYLIAADAYLMPSLWEGFGCSAIEAMGTGLPAILSRVDGLRDFAQTCPDVVWVEPTPESLRDAIYTLRQMTPEHRRAVGQRLSASVHQHFGTAVGAARYAALYLDGEEDRRPGETRRAKDPANRLIHPSGTDGS